MRLPPQRTAAGIALLLTLGATPNESPASAADRKEPRAVTACSRYGNGCYQAPVRRTPTGFEMRLKGGTWIDCRGDCREALREETVDFWDEQSRKAVIVTP